MVDSKEQNATKQNISVTPFERQLGHILNMVILAILMWFGNTAITTSTGLTAAKERVIALEKDLAEVKIRINDSTKDRFTRKHAEDALKEIRDTLHEQISQIGYLEGLHKLKEG